MKEVIVISSLWTVLFVCCVLVSEGPPGSEYFQPVRPLAKRERKKAFRQSLESKQGSCLGYTKRGRKRQMLEEK